MKGWFYLDMAEKLLTGTFNPNTNKQTNLQQACQFNLGCLHFMAVGYQSVFCLSWMFNGLSGYVNSS